jgi:hypothetical protein
MYQSLSRGYQVIASFSYLSEPVQRLSGPSLVLICVCMHWPFTNIFSLTLRKCDEYFTTLYRLMQDFLGLATFNKGTANVT